VFVRYLKNEPQFEVFLESSERVVKQVSASVVQEKERGLKEWAPCWHLQSEMDRVKQQWIEFGLKKV
jgi:hypothetical protein